MWDYIREHDVPVHPLYAQGLHLDRLRPLHAGDPAGRGRSRRPLVVGERARPKECGIHCSIETGGFEHELNSLLKERA